MNRVPHFDILALKAATMNKLHQMVTKRGYTSKKINNYGFNMTHENPFNTPDRFLFIARERKLRGIHGDFGDEIMTILEGAGIRTYGDLLDYAKRKHFSDLPGIGASGAETIRNFIQDCEDSNKQALEAKLHRTQKALDEETNNCAKTRK